MRDGVKEKEEKLDNYGKPVMLPNATGAGCERHDNRESRSRLGGTRIVSNAQDPNSATRKRSAHDSGSPAKGKQQPSSSAEQPAVEGWVGPLVANPPICLPSLVDMDLDSDDAQLRLRPLPYASISNAKKIPAKDFTTVYETRFRNFSRPFTLRPLPQASTSNALKPDDSSSEDSFNEVEAIRKKPQISATTSSISRQYSAASGIKAPPQFLVYED
ncbi:hypothetical protein B0H14DRAFT_2648134 [Mycena olivaceomarginata]|nr:hypothetical protein B0H14DRAFT_2648134 [Mycena olivaceomarginata]